MQKHLQHLDCTWIVTGEQPRHDQPSGATAAYGTVTEVPLAAVVDSMSCRSPPDVKSERVKDPERVSQHIRCSCKCQTTEWSRVMWNSPTNKRSLWEQGIRSISWARALVPVGAGHSPLRLALLRFRLLPFLFWYTLRVPCGTNRSVLISHRPVGIFEFLDWKEGDQLGAELVPS